MPNEVSLYEAKTHLSALVERVVRGEEIVITKKGEPRAKLVGLPSSKAPRVGGQNHLGVTYMAPNFDDPDPEIEAMFYGSDDL